MTFNEWKRLPLVRRYAPQIVDINLEQLSTWHEYKGAVYHADRSQIFVRCDRLREQLFEREEYIAVMTLAWTMDYASIAKEIAEASGFDFFLAGLSHCDDEAREIVAGALLQRD